jgi:hypothetical protein
MSAFLKLDAHCPNVAHFQKSKPENVVDFEKRPMMDSVRSFSRRSIVIDPHYHSQNFERHQFQGSQSVSIRVIRDPDPHLSEEDNASPTWRPHLDRRWNRNGPAASEGNRRDGDADLHQDGEPLGGARV